MSTKPVAASSATGACPDNGVDGDLQKLLEAVTEMDVNASDAVLIDRISLLERLKSAAAAAQARLTATFTASVTTDAAARKHRADATRRSIAGQIGLARRDSPHAGRRHVGVAAALVRDLPCTLAALARGDLSERRARIIVEQLACLTPEHRREADQLLAPDLASMGDRSAETRAAAMAYRLDPEAVMAKIRGAVKDRHVGLRPAPDVMSRLTALLPAAMGVAVYAALNKAAAAATAAPGGDPRSRGQLMADALVSAVTGQRVTGCDDYGVTQYGAAASSDTVSTSGAAADSQNPADMDAAADMSVAASTAAAGAAAAIRPCTGGYGVGINLIMTDRTLLDCDDEPAHLTGFGPVPAALARALVIGAADTGTHTFIRRLYTDPLSGQLTAMDSKRRLFPPAAQRFLLARDHTCRTPWCDAPIREYDHLKPHADGGPTTTANGQGKCKACNLTKEAAHWFTTADDGTIRIVVPTGHSYDSAAPRLPRSKPWGTSPTPSTSSPRRCSGPLPGSAVGHSCLRRSASRGRRGRMARCPSTSSITVARRRRPSATD